MTQRYCPIWFYEWVRLGEIGEGRNSGKSVTNAQQVFHLLDEGNFLRNDGEREFFLI